VLRQSGTKIGMSKKRDVGFGYVPDNPVRHRFGFTCQQSGTDEMIDDFFLEPHPHGCFTYRINTIRSPLQSRLELGDLLRKEIQRRQVFLTPIQITCVAPISAACSRASFFAFCIPAEAVKFPQPELPCTSPTNLHLSIVVMSASRIFIARADNEVEHPVVSRIVIIKRMNFISAVRRHKIGN
jgi:hypothetical protein